MTVLATNRKLVKGFLRTDGTRFVNGDGEEIILTGYATGNWMNPEGFMVGAPKRPLDQIFRGTPQRFDRRRTISTVIWELCGSEYLRTFWDRWEDNHLMEDDIRAMAETGFNSTRLVLNANSLLAEEPGITFVESSFKRLDRVLDWCEKYGIYAILDMHATPAGSNGACGDALNNNVPNLFIDDESAERAMQLWEHIAERYKDRWIVAGYGLLNEPCSLPEEWFAIPMLSKYYDDTIARIRAIDRKHAFFLEGPNFARGFQIFDHDFDPIGHNYAMDIHIYDITPELKVLYPYILQARALNIPMWIGETGSGTVESAIFLELCREYHIGYCIWCWKTAMEEPGRTMAVGYYLPKEWEVIRSYCAGGPKPSYAKAQAIFDEMLENFKYCNCVHNKAAAALTRKRPDIELPGIYYDTFEPDGKRYTGSWQDGNYLLFRIEDRTKLTWLPGHAIPHPPFMIYEADNVTAEPTECLVLELNAGEHVNYSVYELDAPCKASVRIQPDAGTKVRFYCDGDLLQESALTTGDYEWTEAGTMQQGEKRTLRIEITEGSLRISSVRFTY